MADRAAAQESPADASDRSGVSAPNSLIDTKVEAPEQKSLTEAAGLSGSTGVKIRQQWLLS
jgi:hypothetical protein